MSDRTTTVTFGRLQDLSPREAWAHEAHAFTPWLAQNIEHLSEVIGIPLELTGQEVRVESFAADILARNPQDGSVVLIENQLETTDHTHLGQIMTYLAGLEAKTVVWIAPSFREPHVSAIRWLNEHTADGFSFFAIRLRVVRIGDSPFAPIFEVVEKPNDWDRQIAETKREATGSRSELGKFRQEFWEEYCLRHPGDRDIGITASANSSQWISIGDGTVVVSAWLGKSKVGIFIRGAFGTDGTEVHRLLEPLSAKLQEELGARFGKAGNALLGREKRIDMENVANWPEAIDWVHDQLHRYVQVLQNVGR